MNMDTVKTLTEAYVEALEKLLKADVEEVSLRFDQFHQIVADIRTVLV
jgi:hypothetical protein